MRRFENKVVLVTGAASGIGRAAALRMAEEGAALFCADLPPEAVREPAEQASERGGEAEARVCDVSRPEDVTASVAACIERFGKLDSLCNVAGILRFDHALELSLEDWNRVLAVNLTGTFLMCKAALPHLLEVRGNIVNTSSTAALAGLPYGAAYGAALLAGVGAGVFRDVPQACQTAIQTTGRSDPGPAASVYADYYPRYRALYAALKDEFSAVADVVARHTAEA